MNEQVYTNYRLQLPDQEVVGTLVVRDGRIFDIQPGTVDHGINGDITAGETPKVTNKRNKCCTDHGMQGAITAGDQQTTTERTA